MTEKKKQNVGHRQFQNIKNKYLLSLLIFLGQINNSDKGVACGMI